MSREQEIADLLSADSALMALMTGGIYVYADTDQDGITRFSTPSAFDADGYLLPCCLCKQRGFTPDGWVEDGDAQLDSGFQVVEVKLYQRQHFDVLDAALADVRRILRGVTLPASFPLELVAVIDRVHDFGALKGASLAQQDWAIYSV